MMAGISRGTGAGFTSFVMVLLVSGCQLLPDSGIEEVEGHRMSCGDRELVFSEAEDGLELRVDGKRYALEQVEVASGSQYIARDGSETEFWNKGERARVILDGEKLEECTYSSGPTLAGPVWMVTEVDGRAVMTNYRASMHFLANGRVGGRASCNHFNAGWERLGDEIVIEQAATTKMACPTDVMEQEQRFLGAFSSVSRFEVTEKGDLVLRDDGGEPLIRAESRDGGGGPE